jgi:hypothetical protein
MSRKAKAVAARSARWPAVTTISCARFICDRFFTRPELTGVPINRYSIFALVVHKNSRHSYLIDRNHGALRMLRIMA